MCINIADESRCSQWGIFIKADTQVHLPFILHPTRRGDPAGRPSSEASLRPCTITGERSLIGGHRCRLKSALPATGSARFSVHSLADESRPFLFTGSAHFSVHKHCRRKSALPVSALSVHSFPVLLPIRSTGTILPIVCWKSCNFVVCKGAQASVVQRKGWIDGIRKVSAASRRGEDYGQQ